MIAFRLASFMCFNLILSLTIFHLENLSPNLKLQKILGSA